MNQDLQEIFEDVLDEVKSKHKKYLGSKIVDIGSNVDTWGVWLVLTLELETGELVKVEVGSDDQEVPGRFRESE